MLVVEATGPLATVQDRGRFGWAHLGVPRAGALDAPAAALARRLVGATPDAAVIEVTFGGFAARNEGPGCWAAVTGAPGPLWCAGRAVAWGQPVWWASGARLEIGSPTRGVRSYLALSGGIAVDPVLGSRSTDVLAGIGPGRLQAGDRLALGPLGGPPAACDVVGDRIADGVRVSPGPHAHWFSPTAHQILLDSRWQVGADSDRIGVRLSGQVIERVSTYRGKEMVSEPMVLGAIQVPPQGQPIIFLADHPTTGGYPVIGVADPADLWQCAQVRPGETLRLRVGTG